jgi:hypothetical protein
VRDDEFRCTELRSGTEIFGDLSIVSVMAGIVGFHQLICANAVGAG